MKHILRIAIIGLFLQNASSQQAPVFTLRGVVVTSGGGGPISRATVELKGPQAAVTTTEGDGRFFFPNLRLGIYRIAIRRDGFVPTEYGQRWIGGPGVPIELGNAQPPSNLQIPMMETGSISGRITDATGQPIANAQVQALQASYQGQLRILVPVQQSRTNAAGEYRLFWLSPGRYYLSTSIFGWPETGQLIVNSGARVDLGPLATVSQPRPVLGQGTRGGPIQVAGADNEVGPIFYPSTPDRRAAVPIDVRPGSDFRGTDIYLAPIRKFQVCGVVNVTGVPLSTRQNAGQGQPNPNVLLNAAGRGAVAPRVETCAAGQSGGLTPFGLSEAVVQLAPLDIEVRAAANGSGNRVTAYVDPATGQFYFRNVLPGTYDLSTFVGGMSAAILVDVHDTNVERLSLTLAPGATLPTRVVVEGQGPAAQAVQSALSGLRIVIGSDPPSQGTSPNAMVVPNGSFDITNVTPRDNRVYVLPLLNSPVTPGTAFVPPALQNAYVKSARLGDVEVLNTGMRFLGQPNTTLEIVLGINPGAVRGSVVNDRQEPGAAVFVTLIPDAASARLFRTDMYKTLSTDVAGRFEMKGLPPGDYRVFAWEGFERDAWLDPEFFKPYERQGISVRVEEGKTQDLGAALVPIHPERN